MSTHRNCKHSVRAISITYTLLIKNDGTDIKKCSSSSPQKSDSLEDFLTNDIAEQENGDHACCHRVCTIGEVAAMTAIAGTFTLLAVLVTRQELKGMLEVVQSELKRGRWWWW
ncbi:hypothetical protein EG329_002774 [Mollisiaceae sp. DMI_Dod_QoI]|nr:hypothetical protein EG329_002774 [Helotiales sp. DMI_Dod_QoI]